MKILDQELDPRKVMISTIGSLLGIGVVAFLSVEYDAPILVASFGATAVLIYGIPASPLARPRNVFFGHLISATIGVICSMVLGCTWYSMALAVSISIMAMTLTGTLHPPGGATALVGVMTSATPSFIIAPILIGVTAMMIVAFAMNRLSSYLEKDKIAESS